MTHTSLTMEHPNRSLSNIDIDRTEERHAATDLAMRVHEIDPLADTRWDELVARHPDASIFHTRGWLEALRKTYGYQPVVYATTRGTQLEEAVVFCRVESRLTGRRLVSLPFSDHCQPLARGAALHAILTHLREMQKSGLRYVELRPVACNGEDLEYLGFGATERFNFHTIDLRPDLAMLFKRMHDTSVRQRVKRAEREGLVYEVGRSEELLQKFRQLLFLTRRKHKIPPQPAAWFSNIAAILGERVRVHLVSKNGVPVASILTLHFGQQITYKYGCSDPQSNRLGGMPVLIWKAIEQGKQEGATLLDLGRSDPSNPGLIEFKTRLGAQSIDMSYYRTPAQVTATPEAGLARKWAGELLARLPDGLLDATGELLYRHMG